VTEVVRVDPERPNRDAIARAAECLRAGGLVAFPTETVYGLGVHAFDRRAVRRLFDAKGRPANDPLIVHVAAYDQIASIVAAVPETAKLLAARFWPGPLTLVMRRAAAVPDEVTAGLETVAVRVPAHPVAHALLAAAHLPVAAPSANLFSRPSPTRASHVLQDLDNRIDMILDGGSTSVGVESTVLDLTTDPPSILRPGAVTAADLRQVVPAALPRAGTFPSEIGQEAMRSPGLLQKHYAPRAPLTLVQGTPSMLGGALAELARQALARGERVGVLATSEDREALRDVSPVIAELGSASDLAQVASRLYAALRELDEQKVDVILARDIEHAEGLGRAIRDRLHRAAARIVRAD
jgi:L-threonylcarbamoyladenylate synthase